MNKLEASQVVEAIGSIYPNYHPMNLELAVSAWEGIFGDVPYSVVMGALYSYAKNNNEFPPTPGQLNEIIIQAIDKDAISESEAWNMVLVAIRNGAYGAEEEFNKLPEDVQKAIGSPHYLHELALSDNVNYGVESSNFYKNLRIVRERQKNVEHIPDRVKQVIDQMSEAKQAQLENGQEVARLEQKNYYDDLSERTMEKFLTEEREELTEGQKGFADMLRERLGMPKKEEPSADEYSAEYYYDPIQDNTEDWDGGMFA
jgi:hypothetical protein